MRSYVRRALAITLASLVVALSALIAIGGPSSAASLSGVITNVTVHAPHTPLQDGDLITTDITWRVPDGSKAGDTFTLTLPPELKDFPPTGFQLKDPATGEVVADAQISNGVITFTLTAYAESHNNVSGMATLGAHLDVTKVTSGENVDLVYTTDGKVFHGSVTAPTGTTGNADNENPGKYGAFTDATQNRIKWTVWTQTGPAPTMTISDKINSTMQLDCTSPIEVLIGTPTGPSATFVPGVPGNSSGDYSGTAKVTCNSSTNTLTVVTGAIPAGQEVLVDFFTNTVSTTATSFSNTATVTTPSGTKSTDSNTLTKTTAGGSGNGDTPVPAIKILKGDVNGNAADTAATAVTLPTGGTGLVFTITNTSAEALKTVVVTDTLDTANGTVTGLSCDFSKLGGPATGTTWAGPFAVGASFQCTATLSGVTAGTTLHQDTAKVTGVGVQSNTSTESDNPYYGTAPGSVSVGDYVWLDTNHNGIQDSGEKGIGGVTLTLTGPTGSPVTDVAGHPVGTTTTAADGSYTFANLPILPAGQHYTVTIDNGSASLANLVPTLAGVGTDRAVDSSTGSATSVDLTTNGARDATLDFGFVPQPYAIGDYVWNDDNQNGIQDASEKPIAGVSVVLLTADGKPAVDIDGKAVPSPTTDDHGIYHFDNLGAGDYTVQFGAPAGMSFTTQMAGSDQKVDSNVNASGLSAPIHLGPADVNLAATTASDTNVKAPKIDRTIDAGLFESPKGPSIRVEKYDGDNTFTPKSTVSTADKNSDSPKGDADTASTAIVSSATATTPVSITFNNNGKVWLYDVTVIDETVGGTGTVSNLSCLFPDGSKGLYWLGPLTVGATVTCTGTLPALGAGANHEDRVTVYGRPGITTAGQPGPDAKNPPTGKPIKPGDAGTVSDNDLFYVTTPATPGTTTTTTTAVPTEVEAATAVNTAATAATPGLAFTGGNVAPLLALAGGLIVAGTLMLRRRRRDW